MLSLQVTEGLGCAESWNHIIASAPSAPWAVVTAYDVTFLPGQLAKLAEQYEADLQVCLCITRGSCSAPLLLGWWPGRHSSVRQACRWAGCLCLGMPLGLLLLCRGLAFKAGHGVAPR